MKVRCYWRFIFFPVVVALNLASCADPDNLLEGSLGSQYDLSFDSVRIRQFLQSRQLHVEYIRGDGTGEEKPLTLTIQPSPEGPGTFTFTDGQVALDHVLSPGSPGLPDVVRAEVALEEFTPGEIDSEVSGSLHAAFSQSGEEESFTLEGRFKARLELVP